MSPTPSALPAAPPVPGAAIALVGAATLLLEILLTRIFSVTMWYHFAFVSVSLALFGIAASGVAVSVAPSVFRAERGLQHMALAALGMGVATPICFLIDLQIPLAPFDAPGDVGQGRAYLLLLAKFLVLALPFFCSGLAIALAFTHFPRDVHRTYFYDLGGGAVGCVLVVLLLRGLSGPTSVLFVGALALLAAGLLFRAAGEERRATGAVLGVLVVLALVAGNHLRGWVRVERVKSYDPAVVQMREPPKVYERWHPVSRVAVHPLEVSGSPRSWFYDEESAIAFPPVMEITNDGGARTFLYPKMSRDEQLRLFEGDLSDLVFELTSSPDVLVVGVGGGKDVISAVAYGARQVVGVEMNPLMIEVVQEAFADFTGAPFDDPAVLIAVDEGRNYIASRDARYDVIKISVTDTWAASAVGAYALTENYLYTYEAIGEFLDHLKPGGVLSVVRWYPLESMRLAALVRDVLVDRGVGDPSARVQMVRNGTALNLMVKAEPFTSEQISRLRARAERNGLTWIPPVGAEGLEGAANQAEALDRLHHAVFAGIDAQTLRTWLPFDLSAPTDDRPFFFNPVGLGEVDERRYARLGGFTFQHGRALALLVGLLQVSVLVALVFVVAPLALSRRGDWLDAGWGFRVSAAVYFLMLGLGFLLIEIPLLQQFILFLGHPTYAVTVVLFAVLFSSGCGSLLAARLRGRWRLLLFPALVALLAVIALWLPAILRAGIGLPFALRVALAVLVIAPVGLLLGMPFPLGVRSLHERGTSRLVPWAWAINGAASVAAPVLAMIVAIQFGFSRSLALGTVCYVVAGFLLWNLARGGSAGVDSAGVNSAA